MINAVIFDVDGTLVDSVDLHAAAWQRAFAHFGYDVDFAAIRSQIGKGGDQLMPVFLPKEMVERRGKEIEDYRLALFKRDYLPRVRGFPKVRELFQRILAEGKRIALASSAKGDELDAYKKAADIVDLVDEETSSDDAERSKPASRYFRGRAGPAEAPTGSAPSSLAIPPMTPKLPARQGCRRLACSAAAFPRPSFARPAWHKSFMIRPTSSSISIGPLSAGRNEGAFDDSQIARPK